MSLGENIKRVRKERKLTQMQLAKAIGRSHTVIPRYESGVLKPKLDTLKRLADALDCTVNDLLGEESVFKRANAVVIPNMTIPASCAECPFLRMEYSLATNRYVAYCPLIQDELAHGIEDGRPYECVLTEIEEYERSLSNGKHTEADQ